MTITSSKAANALQIETIWTRLFCFILINFVPQRKHRSARQRANLIRKAARLKAESSVAVMEAPEAQPRARVPLTAVDFLLASGAAVMTGTAYFPIFRGMLRGTSDYTAHALFAKMLLEQGILFSPAFLLHALVAALVHFGITAAFETATLVITTGSYAALGPVLYFCSRPVFNSVSGWASRGLPAIIAVTLPFVQPAVPWKGTYTIGYIWAEPFHSPTYVLLKPLALVVAACAAYFLVPSRRTNWALISLCAVAAAAGTLAKPNFTICALPAVVLCAGYKALRRQAFSRLGVSIGIVLPMVAVLVWQHQRTYAGSGDPSDYGDSIIFTPLTVMRLYSKSLASEYLVSILFPLTVLIVYGKRAWDDSGLRFSLIAFAFGTAYTYTLGEKLHLGAGNFLWSAYISLCVLYFFAMVFLLKHFIAGWSQGPTLARAIPCISVLMWHLVIGFSVHWAYLQLYMPALRP